jgi:methylenetetrahydrofolate reductase (NADPH)
MSAQQADGIAEIVRELVRSAHIEVIPLRGAETKLTAIPATTIVTITCSPRFGLDRTLEHAALAVAAGYRVIPHLAARQVADESGLRDFVGRLHDLGIKDLYVIGGDGAEPVGAYRDALELLTALDGIDHGLARIGVACYPEGHPKIADEALLDALLAKQRYAVYMVSQLCFDAEVLVSWLRKVRLLGVQLPLRIGLAAPLKTSKLIELSLKIGVGSSIRFLTKQHGFLGNLLVGRAYEPEGLLRAVGPRLSSAELNIEGLHLFSFNQLDATVEWQRQVAGFVPPARV